MCRVWPGDSFPEASFLMAGNNHLLRSSQGESLPLRMESLSGKGGRDMINRNSKPSFLFSSDFLFIEGRVFIILLLSFKRRPIPSRKFWRGRKLQFKSTIHYRKAKVRTLGRRAECSILTTYPSPRSRFTVPGGPCPRSALRAPSGLPAR